MTEDQFARFVDYAESRFQQSAAQLQRLESVIKDSSDALRAEMRERFEIADNRFHALGTEVAEIRGRLDQIEVHAREHSAKLTDLKEEMQQRFRVVTERLSVLES